MWPVAWLAGGVERTPGSVACIPVEKAHGSTGCATLPGNYRPTWNFGFFILGFRQTAHVNCGFMISHWLSLNVIGCYHACENAAWFLCN